MGGKPNSYYEVSSRGLPGRKLDLGAGWIGFLIVAAFSCGSSQICAPRKKRLKSKIRVATAAAILYSGLLLAAWKCAQIQVWDAALELKPELRLRGGETEGRAETRSSWNPYFLNKALVTVFRRGGPMDCKFLNSHTWWHVCMESILNVAVRRIPPHGRFTCATFGPNRHPLLRWPSAGAWEVWIRREHAQL